MINSSSVERIQRLGEPGIETQTPIAVFDRIAKFAHRQLALLPEDDPQAREIRILLYRLGDAKIESGARQLLEEASEKDNPSQALTEGFQELWNLWGEKVDIQVNVPPCDRTKEEILALKEMDRMLIYIPPEFSSHKDLDLLMTIFPRIASEMKIFGEDLENLSFQSGWLDVESANELPNKNFSPERLKYLANAKREPQTLNTYIIASYVSKILSGEFFELGYGDCVLFNTITQDEIPIKVHCARNGRIRLNRYYPQENRYPVGFRTVGRK